MVLKMGKERGPTYYDETWTSGKWSKDWNNISKVRTRLYRQAALMVPEDAPCVIDLGCGGGHFGQCLKETNPPQSYVGFDFSEAAIIKARKRCGDDVFQFFHRDLRSMVIERPPPPGTVYVCMETLEHIENDMRIFSLIPEGSQIIISVPSFDEPAHVRHFPGFSHVIGRYREKIDFSTVRSHKAIWKWFLFTGKRHEQKTNQAQNGHL
jgi:2-polyprenyl-3-methyl-5-hydroxy-6-metoxy-1,4-benzoquinol methylase